MSISKKNITWIVRVIISALFLLSAIAKSFPIWAFEKQLVDLGIVDWCLAPYLARLIIALEMAIAIAVLQRHYLKTFVIPVTIALLVAFCIHLSIQMYQFGAMNGNCGCFGQLIPMTPLEAVIKNIITIALLIYLYRNVSNFDKGENRFLNLMFIYTLSALIMFFFFPFAPCEKEIQKPKSVVPAVIPDSINQDPLIDTTSKPSITVIDTSGKTTKKVDTAQIKIIPPVKVVSKFSEFTIFSDKAVNIDEGKKIICMFVPGCDHCRHTAKEIVALSKKVKLPPVYIIFMDEELFKLPEFFKETGANYPYYVLDNIPKFFKLLGNKSSTPGVFYMWNGNIIKAYEGINEHQFNVNDFKQAIVTEQRAAGSDSWW